MTQQEIIKRLPRAFKKYKSHAAGASSGNEFCQLMLDLAKQLGFKSQHSDFWNQTIDWLDINHPGWRGYTVVYRNGRQA